ncbi:MAG TPA: hypothetical protein VJ011_02410 [Steroidobacteraceae bacterium]|nr:hypothetical protein [Steroidobacteraceae bacterium]
MPQLGFLKLNVGQADATPDEHRVVALFRNRAELKKAYGELQEEIYRLKDRIKQQEGATQRVQEMLAALEARLALSDTAYPALVFYQLRGLWQGGRELIEQFVADLSRQQDERERRLHLAECNRRRFPRRQEAENALRHAEGELAAARQRAVEAGAARARLTRFWQYFVRRRTERALSAAHAAVAAAEQALTTARAAMEALEAEPLPEFPGLSLEARRAINLAAIAYAEVLCARLAKTPLVTLAKEATARREVSDEYGSRAECEALMGEIARGRTLLHDRANIAQEIRARTERLRQSGRYRAPADTVPTAESLAFSEGDALSGHAGGAAAARMPNVLAEDTWDLFRVLLR